MYKVVNGEAHLVSYNGEEEDLMVPSELGDILWLWFVRRLLDLTILLKM